MALSEKRVAVIHVARQHLGLSDEEYRDLLWNAAGVTSSANLTDAGFEAVMFQFQKLGFKSDWNRRNFGYRASMATPRQVGFIRHLWSEFTDGTGTDETLGKWLEGRFGVSSVKFVPSDKAQKIIGALQAMKRGKMASKGRAA